jgi:hypothetical protein
LTYKTWSAHKGYGRIYVKNHELIPFVENIISRMDEYEYEHYYPQDLVATVDYYPRVVYLGKFDLDLDELKSRCLRDGIKIVIFDAGDDPYPQCRVHYQTKDDIENELEWDD